MVHVLLQQPGWKHSCSVHSPGWAHELLCIHPVEPCRRCPAAHSPHHGGNTLSFLLFWSSLPDAAGCLWERIFTQKNKWCMLDPQASSLEGNKHLQSVCAAPAPSAGGGGQLQACIKLHYPGLAKRESQQQQDKHTVAGWGGCQPRRFAIEGKWWSNNGFQSPEEQDLQVCVQCKGWRAWATVKQLLRVNSILAARPSMVY